MTQGTRLDLGDLIAEKLLKPKSATLLGVDFEIRRDFTPEQVLAYHAETDELTKLRMIVGDAADAVVEKLAPLPLEHKVRVWNRVLRIAGVMPRAAGDEQEDDGEGESSASSQDSPTAGTPSPQTSAASTARRSAKPSANGRHPK